MNAAPWRAVYIDPSWTVLDCALDAEMGKALRQTRGDALDGGLAGLLDALAPRFGAEGVVVLAAETVQRLKLPTERHDPDQIGPLIIADLARAGWKCNKVSDWTTVYGHDRPKLHVCNSLTVDNRRVTDDTKDHEFPLWSTFPPYLVARLRLWHELTGYAYHGKPGMAGCAIMGGLDRERVERGKTRRGDSIPTTWKLYEKAPKGAQRTPMREGPDGAYEDDFRPSYWKRPPVPRGSAEPLPEWAHGYDAIRMYIAAAMLAAVCPWALKHTGRTAFDRNRAGWWQLELAPWPDPRMPDPAGYVPLNGDDDRRRLVRWLTTPTVDLLDELTRRGDYGGYRILDSYTGPARKYPLRPWAERLRDAYALVNAFTGETMTGTDAGDVEWHDEIAAPVQRALKWCGHKTMGLVDHADNWIYRSHLWYSTLALARCLLWRKVWTVGEATGRWPLWIDVDQVWYASNEADPVKAAPTWGSAKDPQGIVIDPEGLQLGRFRPKGTRRLRRAA